MLDAKTNQLNFSFEKQKTTAHRRFVDDVPQDVKNRRVFEMAQVYRAGAEELNAACVGTRQLILIEGVSDLNSFFFLSRTLSLSVPFYAVHTKWPILRIKLIVFFFFRFSPL